MTSWQTDKEHGGAGPCGSVRAFFTPASIAIVGASADEGSLGSRPLDYLLRHGFPGTIYPVNPRYSELRGIKAYPSILDLPEPVDLVVICVPAGVVEQIMHQCAQANCTSVMVLSSGFGEAGEQGSELEAHLHGLAASHGMRLLGPNSEGVFHATERIALSFSPTLDVDPKPIDERGAGVGIVSQSGGLGFAALTAATELGLSIRHVVSTGNESDLEIAELATYMAGNLDVRVVVLIVEGLRDPRRLAGLAAAAGSRGVRLVVVKLGASPAGGRAVARHTGHESGDDVTYEAMFERHGLIRVDDLDELLDVISVLCRCKPMAGNRVGIVTSSGGAGVWLADRCEAEGFHVPELSADLQRELAALMPRFGSAVNPVDITAQAVARGRFTPALEVLARSGEVDAVVVSTSLSSPSRLDREQPQLNELVKDAPVPIVMLSYTKPAQRSADAVAEIGIPWVPSPARAARALAALAKASGTAGSPAHLRRDHSSRAVR